MELISFLKILQILVRFFLSFSHDFLWNRWSRNLFQDETEWLHRRSSSRELGKGETWPTINMIYPTRDQSYARVSRAIMAGALSRTSFIIPLDPPLPLFSSLSFPRLIANVITLIKRRQRASQFGDDFSTVLANAKAKRGSSPHSRSRLPRPRPPPPWFYKASNGIQLEVGCDLARARDSVSRRDSVGTLTVAAAAAATASSRWRSRSHARRRTQLYSAPARG